MKAQMRRPDLAIRLVCRRLLFSDERHVTRHCTSVFYTLGSPPHDPGLPAPHVRVRVASSAPDMRHELRCAADLAIPPTSKSGRVTCL